MDGDFILQHVRDGHGRLSGGSSGAGIRAGGGDPWCFLGASLVGLCFYKSFPCVFVLGRLCFDSAVWGDFWGCVDQATGAGGAESWDNRVVAGAFGSLDFPAFRHDLAGRT